MAHRIPDEYSEGYSAGYLGEESFPILGTPDEPTLEPSVFYMPHTPPTGRAPLRSDADIKHDVESALFDDNFVKSYQIDVVVDQGAVTLTGNVDDIMECAEAEKVCNRVPGVRSISNQCQLRQ